ncbi:MAG: hypothetical protein ACOVRK_01070 [Chryseobacterium taeanense]
MKFDLIYTELHRLQNFEYEIYEEEKTLLEDIYIVRNAFGETKEITFTLKCLEENWNIMIWDLPLFTEHLLDIYTLCLKPIDSEYIMWYHEQDIDRKILFTKIDATTLKVENVSGEKWISPVPYEYINIVELQKDIIQFVNKIKAMVEIVYPEINTLEMLQKWYQSFEK